MHRLIPLLVLLSSCAAQQTPHLVSAPTVTGHAVVASVSADASKVGAQVMFEGGNAVDAAVATAFALAVTYPEAGNIGGGGFMLIHFPDAREPVVIDYRETAPAAVDAKTFAEYNTHRGPTEEQEKTSVTAQTAAQTLIQKCSQPVDSTSVPG